MHFPREQVDLVDDVEVTTVFCTSCCPSTLPIKKLKGTEPAESLDLSNKGLSFASAIVIASLIGVNGGLTALDLSSNRLNDEGISAVCEAIQSNKETKLASLNMGANRTGPMGAKSVAAMVAVTGGLTSLDLSRNQLCGIWTDGNGQKHGTYTAEGITAIADALRVNDGLTEVWETCQPTAS